MKKYLLIITCILSGSYSFSQFKINNILGDTIQEKEIMFIIQDTPSALFSMRQSNENFLSLYRLAMSELNKSFSSRKSMLTQLRDNLKKEA